MSSERTQPGAAPKIAPSPTEISRFFWDGAREHRLLIQRCDGCGRYIHWPQVRCPSCGSERLSPSEVSGRGTVYSFCVVHHVFHPGYAADAPYNLAIVELEEKPGLRLLTNIVGCPNDELAVGMAVEVTFEERDGYVLPQFRPAGSARP
jgi:uncharacterized OB-fold protein